MDLALDQSEAVIGACKAKAAEIGVPMTIAVADAGGNLIALARMDDAILASLEVAISKAYTAVAMRMSTNDLSEVVQPGHALYGLAVAHPKPLATFGGGVPISLNDEFSGAVGVAGGSVDQDQLVAEAALEAVE